MVFLDASNQCITFYLIDVNLWSLFILGLLKQIYHGPFWCIKSVPWFKKLWEGADAFHENISVAETKTEGNNLIVTNTLHEIPTDCDAVWTSMLSKIPSGCDGVYRSAAFMCIIYHMWLDNIMERCNNVNISNGDDGRKLV